MVLRKALADAVKWNRLPRNEELAERLLRRVTSGGGLGPRGLEATHRTFATPMPRSPYRQAFIRRSSQRLGHSSVSITLDTYNHAVPAMQETAAALVAELVLGG
jgi:hypothetical protein